MAYRIVATEPGGVEVLQKQAFNVPDPSDHEVVVRHTAIGVNFIDTYFRSGLYPWPDDHDLVLGSEAAGVVEAVGSGVSGLTPGDRVAYTVAHGGYATHRAIDAKHLVKIPDGVADDVAAAALLKGLTARYLLHDSFAVRADHAVLFHAAAGGVGLIAGQWMASMGVRPIGTAGGPEKCALALQNGYDAVIDYRAEAFVDRFREMTPEGAHVVYDSVGKDTYPGSLRCLRNHGTFVSFGQSSGIAADFKLADLAAGSFHATRPVLFHFTALPGWLDRAAAELFGLIARGDIVVHINQRYALEDAAAAHTALEGRQTTGCTVLIP